MTLIPAKLISDVADPEIRNAYYRYLEAVADMHSALSYLMEVAREYGLQELALSVGDKLPQPGNGRLEVTGAAFSEEYHTIYAKVRDTASS